MSKPQENFQFAVPRPKKGLGPPPKKKRKASAIEEIVFDRETRQEYLTGFHKRKLQRQKLARETAAKREKQDKLLFRKQLREDRQKQIEEHVRSVEAMLKEHQMAGNIDSSDDENEQEWSGIEESADTEDKDAEPALAAGDEIVDMEEEYIDEDRFTTVKVESVTVTRDGLSKPGAEIAEAEEKRKRAKAAAEEAKKNEKPKKQWPKKDKKKFRYENKIERSMDRARQSARNKAKRQKFTKSSE